MWVVDLAIAAQRAKQREERESQWYFRVRRFLRRQHERKIKQRAETKRKL